MVVELLLHLVDFGLVEVVEQEILVILALVVSVVLEVEEKDQDLSQHLSQTFIKLTSVVNKTLAVAAEE
tara:strand:+ start:478 stop:684 length:207 start_codon:yes stop_codon:yes gene_type:complete